MKKVYFLFSVLLFSILYGQVVNIPDANFKAILLQANITNKIAKDLAGNPVKIDQNNDGEIQVLEAENISKISLNNRDIDFIYYFFTSQNSYPTKDIYSLEGINSFKNLQLLDCSYAKLSSIDFTNLTKLSDLYCNNNLITSFTNFQEVKSLFALECSNNKITSLDLSLASLNSDRNEVLFRFNNNSFQYLNLQNNKNTSWMCLCSWIDCPFPVYSNVNTCKYVPFLNGNPNLTEVKINCGEKFYYENTYSNQFIFTENCAVSATQESDFSKMFKIYPNPANDFIAIDTKETITEISILDYSGKTISSKKEKFTHISLQNLPKGNYVMKIKTLEKTFSYKFIKK